MRRPRLVIADDNPDLLRVVADLLRHAFEVVATVMDGEAALQAVMTLDPDVLVIDLSMPAMDGLEAADCVRQLNRRVRIVLLTVQEDLCCDPRIAAVHGYVFKRRAAADLVPAIELALAGGRFASPSHDGRRCQVADA